MRRHLKEVCNLQFLREHCAHFGGCNCCKWDVIYYNLDGEFAVHQQLSRCVTRRMKFCSDFDVAESIRLLTSLCRQVCSRAHTVHLR